MSDSALALLRFDFVPGASDGSAAQTLRDRIGEPVEAVTWPGLADDDHEVLTFDALGGSDLGFPEAFQSVTVRMRSATDAVTEVVTIAIIDADRVSATDDVAAGDVDDDRIRAWERQLGAIRSLLPGEARGPETTVFWLRPAALPNGAATQSVDIAAVERALAAADASGSPDPFVEAARRTPTLLDGGTLVLPREPGQPWGTLLAIDLAGHLGQTVAAGGRRLYGPWDQLAAMYAVHYWCRTRAADVAAFEERLDAAAAQLPGDGIAVDLDAYDRSAATLHELKDDWLSLWSHLDAERVAMRRHLEDASAELEVADEKPSETAAASARFARYAERLRDDLAGIATATERIDRRLDGLATVFHDRVAVEAARDSLALQRRIADWTAGHRAETDRLRWLAAAVVAVGGVLVADAIMTGGLEAFVDQLFAEGLAGFSTQVIVGLWLLAVAIATAVAYQWWLDRNRAA